MANGCLRYGVGGCPQPPRRSAGPLPPGPGHAERRRTGRRGSGRVPHGAAVRVPAFYLTVGLAGNGTGRAVPDVLRWYLNVPADGAAALLQTLVEHLDAGGIPFTVKTLNDPAQHPRPDAMVLYTDRARTPAVAPVVRMSLEQTNVVLRDAVPAFTRRLASGVAIADEPARERRTLSFGQHRSLLVVRGILAAGVGADLQTRWTAVDAEFRRARLDPERPHLGSGNAEVAVQEPGWRA